MTSAEASVASAASDVKSASTVSDIDRALTQARAAMGRARRTGDRAQVLQLERELSKLLEDAKKKTEEIQTRETVALMTRVQYQAQIDRLAPTNLGMALRPNGTEAERNAAAGAPVNTQALGKVKNDVKRYEQTIAFCSTAEEIDSIVADAQQLVDAAQQHLQSSQAQSLRDRLSNLQKAAAAQRHATELLGSRSEQHVDYAAIGPVSTPAAEANFGERIIEQWVSKYVASGVAGDLVSFEVDGHVYLWDMTDAKIGEGSPARLIGVVGRVAESIGPRDNSRISHHKFASDDVNEKLHRGHAMAHQLGGADEGYNLFGQLPEVNTKGLWRHLESSLASNPGNLVFVRAVYTDDTGWPSALEHGHVTDDGDVFTAYFSNRTQKPPAT